MFESHSPSLQMINLGLMHSAYHAASCLNCCYLDLGGLFHQVWIKDQQGALDLSMAKGIYKAFASALLVEDEFELFSFTIRTFPDLCFDLQ